MVKKIPLLGDVPLLGFFLSSSRTDNVESELMVVVSPEILTTSLADARLPTDKK
mgnify:CR=1 FL=1